MTDPTLIAAIDLLRWATRNLSWCTVTWVCPDCDAEMPNTDCLDQQDEDPCVGCRQWQRAQALIDSYEMDLLRQLEGGI